MGCNGHQDAEIHLQGETVNIMNPLIDIPGIDVGGGWRTGCGSHTQGAERVEKLEESVWSVVRQENELDDQREGINDVGKAGTGIRGREMNE